MIKFNSEKQLFEQKKVEEDIRIRLAQQKIQEEKNQLEVMKMQLLE